MDRKDILAALSEGRMTIDEAEEQLQGFNELGFAKIDTQRRARNGYPEVIYGEGKTLQQIIAIAEELQKDGKPILATRLSSAKGEALAAHFPEGKFFQAARCFVIHPLTSVSEQYIAVVTAGTSDIPVAEEAAVTAETFGNQVKRIYDVGVAGIHRLFAHLEEIQKASVVIVIAGMEGALVSVVGGLVQVPVIAVPTSIGYGSNFQGLTALLGMLNSCSSGVSVVNIDNGFGAAYNASMINKIGEKKHENPLS